MVDNHGVGDAVEADGIRTNGAVDLEIGHRD
jgi:hypothetical protein